MLNSRAKCHLQCRLPYMNLEVVAGVGCHFFPGRNPTQDPVGFNRIVQDPTRILYCRNSTQDPIEFNRILSKIL